jgi:hypothetical protein
MNLSSLVCYLAYAFAAYAAVSTLVIAAFLWTESRQDSDSNPSARSRRPAGNIP